MAQGKFYTDKETVKRHELTCLFYKPGKDPNLAICEIWVVHGIIRNLVLEQYGIILVVVLIDLRYIEPVIVILYGFFIMVFNILPRWRGSAMFSCLHE